MDTAELEKGTPEPPRDSYFPPCNQDDAPYDGEDERSTLRPRFSRSFILGLVVGAIIFLLDVHYNHVCRNMAWSTVDSWLSAGGVDTARWTAVPDEVQTAETHQALTRQVGSNPLVSSNVGIKVEELNKSLVPEPADPRNASDRSKRRLIIVGDVHGMKRDLEKLLAKVQFNGKRDHLICTGDMITKGPDSVGVVQLLMDMGASAVQGNHENELLQSWDEMQSMSDSGSDEESGTSDHEAVSTGAELSGRKGCKGGKQSLLKKFSKKQIKWLRELPLALKVGNVQGLDSVAVVHAGLIPGLSLEKQSPYAVMNMRTIDPKTGEPSDGDEGKPWTKLFNKFQKDLPASERTTVIYGHNAKRGLWIKDHTKGLDTGCVKGKNLTAFVIEGGKEEIQTDLVQVKCSKKK